MFIHTWVQQNECPCCCRVVAVVRQLCFSSLHSVTVYFSPSHLSVLCDLTHSCLFNFSACLLCFFFRTLGPVSPHMPLFPPLSLYLILLLAFSLWITPREEQKQSLMSAWWTRSCGLADLVMLSHHKASLSLSFLVTHSVSLSPRLLFTCTYKVGSVKSHSLHASHRRCTLTSGIPQNWHKNRPTLSDLSSHKQANTLHYGLSTRGDMSWPELAP